MQAFAMRGRRNDDDVAQLLVGFLWLDGEELVVGTAADEEVRAPFRLLSEHEGYQLVRMGKAGFVQAVLHTGNQRRLGELAEEQSGAKAEI